MKSFIFAGIALASLCGAAIANADGGSDRPSTAAPATPSANSYSEAEKAVKAKEYEKAIKMLETLVGREPRNVDALNYLAYSHRELGRIDVSLRYYQQALGIDANHRGANEYLGQLYLKMGKSKEAQAQLAKLEKLCGKGCEQYESLRTVIARAGKRS